MMNANVEVKDDFPKTSKKLSFAKILSFAYSSKHRIDNDDIVVACGIVVQTWKKISFAYSSY